MTEVLSFLHSWIMLIVILMLQFYLVKRPQKWCSFVLPSIYFALSIINAVYVMQAGEFIVGSTFITVLLVFIMGNFETLLLLIIYFRRGAGVGTTLVTIFFVYLAGTLIVTFGLTVFAVQNVLDDPNINPSANIGDWYYAPQENVSTEAQPFDLEDLGVEIMPYRYQSAIISDGLFTDHGIYIDSLANDIEHPEKILTVEYEVWLNRHASALEKKEKALQKQYNSECIEAIQDYGADKAYWIGDNLVLRYDNCVILFKEDTTRSVLDSEACAAFFREKFAVEEL